MSSDELREVHTFLAPTRFSARSGIVLGQRLMAAAPADLDEKEQAAHEWMKETTERLYERTKKRLLVSPAVLIDKARAMAKAWVGVRMRLEGIARTAEDESAAEAMTLLKALLPRGTRFVTNDYDSSYTTSAQLLDLIDEQGLQEEVALHVHPEFVPRMRRLHAEFQSAFGVSDTPLSPQGRALTEDIREHADAIANWSRRMAARIDRNDEATIAAFYAAMEPLRRHREAMFAPRGTGDEEGEVTEVEDDEVVVFDTPEEPPALPAEGGATTA